VNSIYVLLKNTLIFGVVLSYFSKSYLKLYINSLQGTESSGEPGARAIAYILVVVLSLAIVAILVGLSRNKGMLQDPNFFIKYGALYNNIRRERFSGYQFIVFFLARRMIYALSIVYLASLPGLQLYIQVLMSLG
jgi:hypothetical protein